MSLIQTWKRRKNSAKTAVARVATALAFVSAGALAVGAVAVGTLAIGRNRAHRCNRLRARESYPVDFN